MISWRFSAALSPIPDRWLKLFWWAEGRSHDTLLIKLKDMVDRKKSWPDLANGLKFFLVWSKLGLSEEAHTRVVPIATSIFLTQLQMVRGGWKLHCVMTEPLSTCTESFISLLLLLMSWCLDIQTVKESHQRQKCDWITAWSWKWA